MKLLCKGSSLYKNKPLLVKLGVSVLFVGLAFRFLFSEVSPVSETPFADNQALAQQLPVSVPAPESSIEEIPVTDPISQREPTSSSDPPVFSEEKCDIFKGDWIPNPSGPFYTNDSCQLIESHQNCMKNGRPDSGYLYWKWRPKDCELHAFDAMRFLQLMRNKVWGLIGDSISRNHVQSLLCMLSKVEKPVEVYHDEEYRSKRWHFPMHNFTVSVIWSPFLVKSAIFEDYNGVSTADIELHLDKLDKKWTDVYQSIDYIIISTGKWFLKNAIYYEDDEMMGCHNCKGKNLTELGFDYAYRKVLRNVLNFISTSKHKGSIFFRTSTPDHFENGEWFSGGSCTRTTPVKEGEIELKDMNKILLNIELEEFKKASEKASERGTNLKLLDFTHLLLLRPDGHPGPYRYFYPFAKDTDAKVINDCLHWCLPGPIDSWNELIMEMIVNG